MNGRSVENMSPEDLQKVLYQCGGDTIMLDVWRQTTPLSSAGSSPVPIVANVQEHLLNISPMKSDTSKGWEVTSESSKGSLKNIKSSGSQTDSLDSPGIIRRNKDRKHSDKDLDHKGRHSGHIYDKALETVNKIFRPRHKSSERSETDKGTLTLSRPRTMIEDSSECGDVVGEFSFPQHQRDNSGSSNTNRSSGRSRELDLEISGTGTWPKRTKNTNPGSNGTVIQKYHPKRPTIDAVINHPGETIPTARVPPLPPERNVSSFAAARHTPQNSDSTITYSHPPSPSLSPQPSNSSSYIQKSPNSRRSFNHEPSDSQTSLSQSLSLSHSQGRSYSQTQHTGSHSHGHPGPQSNHRSTKANTKNPPRMMPHIPSQVATGQFNLDLKSNSNMVGRRRHNSRDTRNPNMSLSPTSQPSGRMDFNQFSSRSNNTTPEPLNSPPEHFTDRPPVDRPYPTPNKLPYR